MLGLTMWTEESLLAVALDHFARHSPAHLLGQVGLREGRVIDGVLALQGRRIAIEAKVSRSDFRRETDAKRAPSWGACHECAYLAPAGVIRPADLPDGWGLWEVDVDGLTITRPGVQHTPTPEDSSLLATALLCRLVAESAQRPPDAGEVERLTASLASQRSIVAREKARAQDAAEQVLAMAGDDTTCRDCGEPVTYRRTGNWVHRDRGHERRCAVERAEAERLRRVAATGAEYVSVVPPRVLPTQLPISH